MYAYSIGDSLKTIAAKLWLIYSRFKSMPKPRKSPYYKYLQAAINDFLNAPNQGSVSTLIDAIRSLRDSLQNEELANSAIFNTAITIDGQTINLLSLCEELENMLRMAPE